MVKRSARIVNKLGLHARPSAMLVSTAAKYKSEVYYWRDSLRVNGKSIMGVMMLAAERGAEITIEAEGPDETAVVDELVKIIESGFGEHG